MSIFKINNHEKNEIIKITRTKRIENEQKIKVTRSLKE